jgi:hypothetical protein
MDCPQKLSTQKKKLLMAGLQSNYKSCEIAISIGIFKIILIIIGSKTA